MYLEVLALTWRAEDIKVESRYLEMELEDQRWEY